MCSRPTPKAYAARRSLPRRRRGCAPMQPALRRGAAAPAPRPPATPSPVSRGTVTLLLDCPPNQPHRGEIAKMMVRVARRGRGIARALMVEAERVARERGRTLLTLDTADEEGAGPLYEKLGFVKAGVIPAYAYK